MPDAASVVKRYVDEVWNGHDFDALDDIVAEDFVRHGTDWEGGDVSGRQGMRQFLQGNLAVIPDLRQNILQQTVHGDHVFMRHTVTGTHKGSLMGEEPTGKKIEFGSMWIVRVQDGKVAEEWTSYDTLAAMMQMGIVQMPTPGA